MIGIVALRNWSWWAIWFRFLERGTLGVLLINSLKETNMLEDEVLEIWGEYCRGDNTLNGAEAAMDYFTVRRGLDCTSYGKKCRVVHTLIKGRLIEALSSPNSYIRELGRLIMEEQK